MSGGDPAMAETPRVAARSRHLTAIRLWAKPALFLSLTLGPVIAFPAWYHHDLKLDSPVFETEAEVRNWLDREERGQGAVCIPSSIDVRVERVADHSGWFAEFRCNSPAVYIRLLLAFVLPGTLALLLAMGLLSAKGKKGARPSRSRKP